MAGLLFAIVSIIEKHLISKSFETVTDFLAAFGAVHMIRASLLLVIAFPSGISLNTPGVAWSLAAGVCIAITLAFYFYALSLEETSRIAPVVSTTPAFTVLISIMVFRESLSVFQLSVLLVIIIGSFVINLRPANDRLRFLGIKPFAAAVASAFFAAWALVFINQSTMNISPVNTELIRTLVVGLSVGLITWLKAQLRAAWIALARPQTAILFIVGELVIATGFMLLTTYALSVGPVGPVSAMTTAISPVAVLIGATVLSTGRWNLLGESVDSRTLLLKTVGTGLIVWGVFSLRI